MEKKLKDIPSKKIIELFNKTKQFNDYLKKEQKSMEKNEGK